MGHGARDHRGRARTGAQPKVVGFRRNSPIHAGVADKFEHIFSADEVGALKPAPQPNRMVADRTAVDISQLGLIAAHAWDVSGALAAGCRAPFVAGPGMVPSLLGPQPAIMGADLDEVAEAPLNRAN